MKLFTFLLIFTFSYTVFSAEIKMAAVTSDIDTDTTVFYLETDDQNAIHSMRYITTTRSGQITEDESFTLDQASGGIVTERRDGFDIIKIYLEDFHPLYGGTLRLNYLVNALRGTKKDARLILKKIGHEFLLFDLQGKPINKMFCIGNRIPIAGLVGLRDIQMSFTPGLFTGHR